MVNGYDAKKFNRDVGEGISKGEDAATHHNIFKSKKYKGGSRHQEITPSPLSKISK
jgi:hypothetical protein